MKFCLSTALSVLATTAWADVSCKLDPTHSDEPSAMLVRDRDIGREAIVFVSGRTLTFDCPQTSNAAPIECYGTTAPPASAATQLNVTSDVVESGAIVVVTTRNLFFGKNPHIGYHRRHASVRVYQIETCNTL